MDESSWPKGCGPWVFVVPLLPANTSSYPSHPSLLPFFSTSFSSKPSTLPWLPLKSVHFLPYLGHWLPSSEAAWRHQETFISSWVLRNCETASNQTAGSSSFPPTLHLCLSSPTVRVKNSNNLCVYHWLNPINTQNSLGFITQIILSRNCLHKTQTSKWRTRYSSSWNEKTHVTLPSSGSPSMDP